jgi:hypothetical protein
MDPGVTFYWLVAAGGAGRLSCADRVQARWSGRLRKQWAGADGKLKFAAAGLAQKDSSSIHQREATQARPHFGVRPERRVEILSLARMARVARRRRAQC